LALRKDPRRIAPCNSFSLLFSNWRRNSHSLRIMSLCLLSRRPQNFGLCNFGTCFRLSKAMIALLFDSGSLQSTCSTSQPRQQKSLWRQLLPPLAEHSITPAATSPLRLYGPFTAGEERQRPQHLSEGSKSHGFSSAGSSDCSWQSSNSFPDNRLCLVCGSHTSASCRVCDQDFCSNHLYVCLDCSNCFCGGCLDDHRADGHWTDSDTAAELNHGWKEKSVSGNFPAEKDGLVSGLDRTQWLCSDQPPCPSSSSDVPAPTRDQPSSRLSRYHALTPSTSLFVRVLRRVCSCLSWSAVATFVKLLSQSELPLEVSL
jgi:hypothetical protein